MANNTIKTLKDLTIIPEYTELGGLSAKDLMTELANDRQEALQKTLNILTKIKSVSLDNLAIEQDMLKVVIDTDNETFAYMQKRLKGYQVAKEYLTEHLKKQGQITKGHQETNKAIGITNQLLKQGSSILDGMIRQNREIYEISHNMQTESNITWRQFTELYQGAYQAARQMNAEMGKQVLVAKDIVATQDKLLSAGWKNIDASTLTNVTGSMALLQRTLGGLDDRLIHAFEISFRQFGSQTDTFITNMGNRLNAFSNTFGMTVSALSSAVADVVNVNTFIARNNMNAQLQANESFMQAASLSSLVGITSFNYLSSLAKTAQFGTASDLISIYESGAYLQNFNTAGFIDQMSSGNTYEANQELISSIYNTLTGMEDNKLLRNQYMQSIQKGFGFSQEDIVAILNQGGNLDTYDAEVRDKLLGVNNSMLDELKDLKMTFVDQVKNWFTNSRFSEVLGSTMNELGLYGLSDPVRQIRNLLLYSAGKNTDLGSLLFGTAKGSSGATGATGATSLLTAGTSQVPASQAAIPITTPYQSNLTSAQRFGIGFLGAQGMIASQSYGYNTIANNAENTNSANALGYGANILGGAASGAMIGSLIPGIPGIGTGIGAGIGALIGVATSLVAADKQKDAMSELEATKREQRRANLTTAYTDDPIINTINSGVLSIVSAITNEGENTRSFNTRIDLSNKGTTKVNGSVFTP